jgi:hypothetical protein
LVKVRAFFGVIGEPFVEGSNMFEEWLLLAVLLLQAIAIQVSSSNFLVNLVAGLFAYCQQP